MTPGPYTRVLKEKQNLLHDQLRKEVAQDQVIALRDLRLIFKTQAEPERVEQSI